LLVSQFVRPSLILYHFSLFSKLSIATVLALCRENFSVCIQLHSHDSRHPSIAGLLLLSVALVHMGRLSSSLISRDSDALMIPSLFPSICIPLFYFHSQLQSLLCNAEPQKMNKLTTNVTLTQTFSLL